MKSKTLNFILFQISWFVCVLGAASGYPVVGPILVGLVLAFESKVYEDFPKRLLGYITVALIGVCIDLIAFRSGAFSFTSPSYGIVGYPLWMISLWFAFATTFQSSLSWLKGRYVLLSLFGLTGGPLAYYSAAQLGAVVLSQTGMAFGLTVIGIAWAVITPLSFYAYYLTVSKSLSGRTKSRVALFLIVSHGLALSSHTLASDTNQASICNQPDVCFARELEQDGVKLHFVRSTKFTYFLFDVYTVALYESSETPQARALAFHYHRSISAVDMIKGADKNLRDNPNVSLQEYSSELVAINKSYYDVGEGSRYWLLAVPGHGLTLRNENGPLVSIPNDKFAQVYLGIWLSDYPLSHTLRDKLLGVSQ
ncbi:MAG: DUF2878 family protein [Bdellovibrionales bacterium]|nr:DUF2878 family protein [Bdellovibrionales bacterium]